MRFQWVRSLCRTVRSWFTVKEPVKEVRDNTYYLAVLNSIERNCKIGDPEPENLTQLLEVAEYISVAPSIHQFTDKSLDVSFLAVTSQGLLESVAKKYYTKQTIIRSYLINIRKNTVPLNQWWSNDESIYYFLIFMKKMTSYHFNSLEENIHDLKEEEEFINSYLYRLLVSDYIDLLKLILMEINYYEN